MTAEGIMLIAGETVAGTAPLFRAIDPRCGEAVGPEFGSATQAACQHAEAAFDEYRTLPAARRAQFLGVIADQIEEISG